MQNLEVFDFHCHPFRVREQNICQYDTVPPRTPAEFLAGMDQAGVSRFAGSVVYNVKKSSIPFEEIRALNDAALALSDTFGERYVPGVHVHPGFGRESLEELERMQKKGVRLVGELVPYLMGWGRYSSAEATEIFGVAGELGMVISGHTMDMDDMDDAVRKVPGTTFVFAHPGEKELYLRHIERMEKYKNVYLDLSGNGLIRMGMLAYGVSRLGAERFLFGTDYPVCNAGMQLHGVLAENLCPSDRDAILAGNAKRLLGME